MHDLCIEGPYCLLHVCVGGWGGGVGYFSSRGSYGEQSLPQVILQISFELRQLSSC